MRCNFPFFIYLHENIDAKRKKEYLSNKLAYRFLIESSVIICTQKKDTYNTPLRKPRIFFTAKWIS